MGFDRMGSSVPMLYQIHEWQRSFLGPLSYFAQANARMLNDNSSPLAQLPGAQRMAAGYELFHRLLVFLAEPMHQLVTGGHALCARHLRERAAVVVEHAGIGLCKVAQRAEK